MVKKVVVVIVDFTEWFVSQIHGGAPPNWARCGQG